MFFARQRVIAAIIVGMGWMSFAGTSASQASVLTLTDANSTAKFESLGGQANPVGQFSWNIDGYNALARQWFWYRIGSTGPEQSIDALDANPTVTQPLPNYGTLTYQGATLTAQVSYLLSGGQADSGQSTLNELIVLTNTSSTTMPLHFFQYVDINLFDSPASGDTLSILNGTTAVQTNPTSSVSETVTTPAPTSYMVGLTPTVLNLLTDGSPTTLGHVGGAATGDVSWAFGWDFNLAPGATAFISKVKNIDLRSPTGDVPEPATLGLLAAGLLVLVGDRRKAGQRYRPGNSR